ncbi:CDP-alcohol phosphatidyltransferase [Ekhidna lutea]|uniref:CDP-alcohol phosphatidyltransferase n=1 Tax=Ekhidna lutea TaxID=447679 RepID=A0A239FT02_EKHLU|nr:CDP-alcohol phosphatidyltransferase family protein [Ekhidna lutea]SNS59981.1 CDP-alcohol phosphatidyltransferase [Ekhidna lutea]
MLGYLRRRYKQHLDEVHSTIKLIDVEERYDIYFSRFYGLYFAKIARWFRLTPTHVSLISLVIGIAGGVLFYFQDQFYLVLIGSLLVIWAGVLDSADGQLARMTGQSSELGRQIDGLIDNLVFISCYIGGTLYFIPEYGYWILILMVASGVAHSYKAGLYEFYKSEYIYLVGKSKAGYIPLTKDEIKPTGDKWHHKVMHYINLDYTGKQISSTTRTPEERKKMRELAVNNPKEFDPLYGKLNFKMLFWWAWLGGSNTHRNTSILFVLMGRFDLFLALSLIWTVGYWPLNLKQRKYDKELLRKLSSN